jgi:NitT/TauT family transport system substrate-binding protein
MIAGRGRAARVAVLVAALALVSAACGGGGGATGPADPAAAADVFTATEDPLAPKPLPEKTTVTVGIGGQLEVYAQYMMAQAEGEFAKENIEVQTQDVPESDKLALLSQGRMDLGYNALTAGLLNLMSTGAQVRWAFPGAAYSPDSKQGYWFSREAFGPDGPQPAELRGKDILTPSGNSSISAYYLWEWVRRTDPSVQLSELTFTAMKPNEIALAMSNGAAQVAQVVSPGSAVLENDPCCVFVDTGYPSTAVIGWVGSEDFLTGKPEVAMAFFRALARTQQTYLQGDYHANPEVAPKLAEQMGIPAEQLATLPNLLFDPALDLGANNLAAQTYWRELGLLNYDADLTEADVYDTRYVDVLRGSAS